jgi:hypothetical protein
MNCGRSTSSSRATAKSSAESRLSPLSWLIGRSVPIRKRPVRSPGAVSIHLDAPFVLSSHQWSEDSARLLQTTVLIVPQPAGAGRTLTASPPEPAAAHPQLSGDTNPLHAVSDTSAPERVPGAGSWRQRDSCGGGTSGPPRDSGAHRSRLAQCLIPGQLVSSLCYQAAHDPGWFHGTSTVRAAATSGNSFTSYAAAGGRPRGGCGARTLWEIPRARAALARLRCDVAAYWA